MLYSVIDVNLCLMLWAFCNLYLPWNNCAIWAFYFLALSFQRESEGDIEEFLKASLQAEEKVFVIKLQLVLHCFNIFSIKINETKDPCSVAWIIHWNIAAICSALWFFLAWWRWGNAMAENFIQKDWKQKGGNCCFNGAVNWKGVGYGKGASRIALGKQFPDNKCKFPFDIIY